MEYTSPPARTQKLEGGLVVNSYLKGNQGNIDWRTVDSFGEEWERFQNFTREEIDQIGDMYFDIVSSEMLPKGGRALDVGCGTGRWSRYLSTRVGHIEAIDPSAAAFVAARKLRNCTNVRVSQAEVDDLPFPDESFDFVFSLGVLHHIPNTAEALKKCTAKLKVGGWCLIYLYYSLDNRGPLYRLLFNTSNLLRLVISNFPGPLKRTVCDAIAALVYWPLARLSRLLCSIHPAAEKIPLSFYRDRSFFVMRNDALDRFGTPLEQRFSQGQIKTMMIDAGLTDILFSDKAPYWHAVGRKRNN